MMSKFINKSLLCLLAVLMLFGAVTPDVFAMENTEQTEEINVNTDIVEMFNDSLYFVANNEEVSELVIYEYDKLNVYVEGANDNATYQWQIMDSKKENVWHNIYDANEKSISVSLALVKNILREDGTSYLRCIVSEGENAYLSNNLKIVVKEDKPVTTYVVENTNSDDIVVAAEDAEVPEFVTVKIEYIEYVYVPTGAGDTYVLEEVGSAFTSYVATLKSGTDFEVVVPNPTIVGFDSFFRDEEGNKTECDEVTISLTNIQEDVTYTVIYEPALVNYGVKYYFQNIYDDLYVENTTLAPEIRAEGYTGTKPDVVYTQSTYPGFTALYYEPETIAADGSTLFCVYYERDYYLMEFDCDGGYGADTVYVRYGTYVSIPNPVRAGYVFDGWDLIESDNPSNPVTQGDNVRDTLPTTLPYYNTAYKALWTNSKTSYTIAYWIKNDDGDTYIGSRKVTRIGNRDVISGDIVSGSNDLEGQNICGNDHANHTNACKQETDYLRYLDAETNKNIIVQGDGSTVVNVYYAYREYTLRFYYAKKVGNRYYVCGNTTEFANGGNNNTAASMETNLSKVHDNWSEVKELPEIIPNGYTEISKYTTGSQQFTVNGQTGQYYYIEFTAPYNSNISTLWPVEIFGPAEGAEMFDYGPNAQFSAWNVESGTYYDATVGNKTVKGNIQYLDYNLLMNNNLNDYTINFLGFWENAKDGLNWNFPHRWEYNVWVPTLDTVEQPDKEYKTRGNIKYELYLNYEVYDNNTPTNNLGKNEPYHGQTPAALEGFTISDWEADFIGFYDTSTNPDLEINEMNFYYTRNSDNHLTFFNHDALDEEKTENNVPFDTKLDDFNYKPSYPSTLEPGAYEFDGWYTTSNFIPGTKLEEEDWENLKMSDSSLQLYARWVYVIRNVYFYYDYSDFEKAKEANFEVDDYFWFYEEDGKLVPEQYPIKVSHGSLVGTAYNNAPESTENYTFIGWFYMDEDNKKRFAPDTMEVKKDLHLFAEWRTAIDTTYKISYKLEHEETINGVVYPAGTVIAEDTTGHLTAGRTKTFTAKTSDELFDLFKGKNLFPLVNSHSVLMEQDASKNEYTFTYVYDKEVYYRVRYIDKITGNELHASKVALSTSEVVTERFVPISGYLPESYYIRKVLASDGYSGPENITANNNEIIFYYIPDTKNGLYTVMYYTETLDGKWNLEQSEVGSKQLNTTHTVTIDKNKFNGFTYNRAEVVTYSKGQNGQLNKNVVESGANANNLSGKINENGLEFNIYYKRNEYAYTIEYREYGSSKAPLHTITGKMKYQDTVEHTAPSVYEYDGIKYLFYETPEKKQTQSLEIRSTATENVLTFYYQPKEVEINYVAKCFVANAEAFGGITLNYESVISADRINGSNAIPGIGYKFVGWFTDEECENPVPVSWRYIPGEKGAADKQSNTGTKLIPGELGDVDSVTYYAKFEPMYGRMEIFKNVVDDNNQTENVDDIFMFKVQGQGKLSFITLVVSIKGNGSVTLTDLPIGEYVVTELSNWSWKYTNSNVSNANGIVEVENETDTESISFTNTIKEVDWLNGETSEDNLLK